MPQLSKTATVVASALVLFAGSAAVAQAKTPAKPPAKTPIAVTAKPITKPLIAKNRTTTITIRNTTARRMAGLSLAVGTRKGVKVTLPGARKKTPKVRALKPLAARKTMRVPVRLAALGKKPPKNGAITVSIRRNGKVIGRARLVFGPKAVRPPATPATLTGRHFWRSQLRGSGGVDQHTVYFTDAQFVFTGRLEDAWPVCTAASETCRPYTYNPKTGALTIDGAEATLEGARLTMNARSHWELGRPVAGARWDIVLTHANASGICPMYCFARTEHLRFMPDGTFVRSSVSSGTGPVVDWAVVPDDSKGTYEVTSDRLLRLAFADGTQRVRTLGIYPEDGPNPYPANPTAGVVLGNNGYFDIRD